MHWRSQSNESSYFRLHFISSPEPNNSAHEHSFVFRVDMRVDGLRINFARVIPSVGLRHLRESWAEHPVDRNPNEFLLNFGNSSTFASHVCVYATKSNSLTLWEGRRRRAEGRLDSGMEVTRCPAPEGDEGIVLWIRKGCISRLSTPKARRGAFPPTRPGHQFRIWPSRGGGRTSPT